VKSPYFQLRISYSYEMVVDLAKPTLRERQIRAAALGKSVSEIEAELEEMANDPDIQRELAAIELDFSIAY
jgi:hypothetical protein